MAENWHKIGTAEPMTRERKKAILLTSKSGRKNGCGRKQGGMGPMPAVFFVERRWGNWRKNLRNGCGRRAAR